MSGHGLPEGAYRKVAPFLFLWFAFALPAGAMESPCRADRIDERVEVEHVYDGDTVRLRDGRKIRLIGIDTPELGKDGREAEPFAEEARAALTKWLAGSPHLLLRHDTEAVDHYGRRLAHAYFEDGRSVAERLLAQGLAVTLVVPPNVFGAECRQKVEHAAQAKRGGLWRLPRYDVITAAQLTPETEGFRRVEGIVTRASEREGDLWLRLDGRLSVHISRADRGLFSVDPTSLRGKRLRVQGEIKSDRRGSYLRVRHPSAMILMR